jgi:hypothetical protein
MNFIGAPALTAAEFKDYRQNFILGASLRVTAPLGQYDSDKLVNIGTNRWSLKPEIGFSKAFGRWTVELAPAVTFYTDNGDFFGGQTRAVAPLYSVQGECQLQLHARLLAGAKCCLFRRRSHDRRRRGERRRAGRHALRSDAGAAGEPVSFREALRHHRL